MHHSDAGYDTTDPELTPQQRDILEFSGSWFNLPTQPNRHEYAEQSDFEDSSGSLPSIFSSSGVWGQAGRERRVWRREPSSDAAPPAGHHTRGLGDCGHGAGLGGAAR